MWPGRRLTGPHCTKPSEDTPDDVPSDEIHRNRNGRWRCSTGSGTGDACARRFTAGGEGSDDQERMAA